MTLTPCIPLTSKIDVFYFEDLRRFSEISVISRLESRRQPISEIVTARPGIESQTFSSTNQELNIFTTAAPKIDVCETLMPPSQTYRE